MFKTVLVGCGSMANTWLQYALAQKDVEVAALVDLNLDNAAALGAKYGLQCGVYRDLPEAIAATGADLVFDVTPPEAHHTTVITALEAGCHVFGEKPMAASMAQAREMVATAQKTGKMYAVMQNRRYLKQIRAFRQLLASGVIGKLGFICADFFLGPHFGGFREIMASPLILDMAIHTFDQARFLIGAEPVSVYCHEFNPPGSWYRGNAAAVCIFEFADGSVFCYRGSWCAEGAPTSWEATWRITGSKGTALWDGFNPPYAEVVTTREENAFTSSFQRITAEENWQGKEGHAGCLEEMFTALREGRPAETDCRDNLKSLAMVFGALASATKGCKVDLRRL